MAYGKKTPSIIFIPPAIIPTMAGLFSAKLHPLPGSRFWRCLMIAVILTGMLPACTQNGSLTQIPSVFSDWKLADLRLLQAPKDDPAHSLIALYSRITSFDLEIRLDFLDLTSPLDFDVYLTLDTRPGGGKNLPFNAISGIDFDMLVKIPATGAPQAFDAQLQPMASLVPRSANHPGLDMMTVQLNRSVLPGNPSEVGLQAFITLAGKPEPLSQTTPVFPSTYHLSQAPVLLVFWNALPAATPAQILRRWDGAHTGPYGGRHGLNVLLQAAAAHNIPLVLADLKQPASFTALSAVGGLNFVRRSALRGDLILPESAAGDPLLADLSLAASRQTALDNKFPSSPIAFGAFSEPLPENYSLFFADLPGRSSIVRWQSKRLIPLPGPVFSDTTLVSDPQVAVDGLTIFTRQALLTAALSADPGDLVVLGGSLPESAWGEFSTAPAAFAYIAAHPWIKPLDEIGLTGFPSTASEVWPLPETCQDLHCSPAVPQVFPVSESGTQAESSLSLVTLRSVLRGRLGQLKKGPLAQLALQSYLSLSQPADSPVLAGLQANALGYVSYQVEAARWDEFPFTKTDCSVDVDFDGKNECLLASPTWFVILKTSGGRLVYAAHRGPFHAAQWIGSPAQFGVGLGDPSEWKPEQGPTGNPVEIPGAFGLENSLYEDYVPEIQSGKIILNSEITHTQKIFSLSSNELHIELAFAESQHVQIPITLAPQHWASGSLFSSWLPEPELTKEQWQWQPDSVPGLSILFQDIQTVTAKSSLDSSQWLTAQENPDLAYPPGHYLTFPMAVIEVQGAHFSLTFQPR